MSPINRRIQGKAGEDLAAKFLEQNGLKILERNYRFERGEIDLIAEEGDELVFVEVKARTLYSVWRTGRCSNGKETRTGSCSCRWIFIRTRY